MNVYFPYSALISSLCNSVRDSISRHAYISESMVGAEMQTERTESTTPAIAELYY